MKPDKIKELLQKYYEGETSLEEEAQLQVYLTNIEQVPEELKADAEIAMMMPTVKRSAPSIFMSQIFGARISNMAWPMPINASPTINPAANGTSLCSQKPIPFTLWIPIWMKQPMP